MTELRQRMIDDMVLASLAPETRRQYVLGVRQLAEHYGRSPDRLSEEEVRAYLVHLSTEKRVAKQTYKVKLAGIKFLYQKTLGVDWRCLRTARPQGGRKLPVVLSREEVRRLFRQIRKPKQWMCSMMLYSCGLRVSEGVQLQIQDIDGDRMLVHVRGKGNKDRWVPVAERTLRLLRRYWRLEEPEALFFQSRSRRGSITARTMRHCISRASQEAGILKKVTPHTLRHSYATHLLEQGVEHRVIQGFLGHASARTTSIYTHLTSKIYSDVQHEIDALVKDL